MDGAIEEYEYHVKKLIAKICYTTIFKRNLFITSKIRPKHYPEIIVLQQDGSISNPITFEWTFHPVKGIDYIYNTNVITEPTKIL